jgi:hypothetical protein
MKKRTSVSMAKSGFHPSGGIIFAMPYFRPSGAIFRMYSIGFLNSSSVGLNVGASCSPCGRDGFESVSLDSVGCPRRSTVLRSRGSAWRALSGNATFSGIGVGAVVGGNAMLVLPAFVVVEVVPFKLDGRIFRVVVYEDMPPAGDGPTFGVDTITSPCILQFDACVSPLLQMRRPSGVGGFRGLYQRQELGHLAQADKASRTSKRKGRCRRNRAITERA